MEQERLKDKIRGCLMAGAAGDALGYEVEFMSRRSILSRFEENGITKFELDSKGKALISDDTQMTLFTANGLLNAPHLSVQPQIAVARAYVDWYYTQLGPYKTKSKSCWLRDIDELYSRRAPGNTCPEGKQLEDTLELSEIILALADDLSTGCIISENEAIDTPEKRQWYERYCELRPSGISHR